MNRRYILLIIILGLSAFTHLWNPIGFPDLFSDEGHYLRRAMHVLVGLGPQEGKYYYDHPFFGQIFLAAVFKLIGYPNSLNSVSGTPSVEMLWFVPRVLMGILALFDTFLIYKITERRYGGSAALVASILFAIMPMSWFTRRIFLESIQLPFLLFAIYFALDQNSVSKIGRLVPAQQVSVILSGIALGLAIFTKIPAFTVIPLIGYLVFTNNNRSWYIFIIWTVPVILIPLIWPAYAIVNGDFDNWYHAILFQTSREGSPFSRTFTQLIKVDPLLLVLAFSGLILSAVKRDKFILIWFIPNLFFLFLITWQYTSYQFFIPLLPLFCILASLVIVYPIQRIKQKTVRKVVPWVVMSAVASFGFISTSILITTNVTSAQFETYKTLSQYLNEEQNKKISITLIGNPVYVWVFKYVFHKNHVLQDLNGYLYDTVRTDKKVVVVDKAFRESSSYEARFLDLYNSTSPIFLVKGLTYDFHLGNYPLTSLNLNSEGLRDIEIRETSIPCVNIEASTILVKCKSANLTDVYNALLEKRFLYKQAPKVWILNANLQIENDSTFYINLTDTKWLKINSTNGSPHYIISHGNLIIDSVNISGWDTRSDDYAKTDENSNVPRAFILVNKNKGLTNITNTEISHLGYNQSGAFGLVSDSNASIILKNNKIHDLYYGLKSGQITGTASIIENTEFYNNSKYGVYIQAQGLPVKHNQIYNNGDHGIMCAGTCYGVLFDSNKIYNNTKEGIMLYSNVSNSVIRNNVVSDNRDQIALYRSSDNNEIFNNTIKGGNVGIRISNSSKNSIHTNSLINSKNGIYILDTASGNKVYSNRIFNTTDTGIRIQDPGTKNNVFSSNMLLDNQKSNISSVKDNAVQSTFMNNIIESSNKNKTQ